jgi:beta-galactosidase
MKPLCAIAPKLPKKVLYGGDYNPEQWPEEVWQEDVRLMRDAGVNLVSVAIFSWAKLEPRPGEYNFDWLDRVIALLWDNGISVCLATATASPPPWLRRAHPESLPVDENGVRLEVGSRQHYCPNSTAYREHATRLARLIAERYARHPAVALWHINNEVGCHIHACYCDVCAGAFRVWLKKRYTDLATLNDAWGTAFWSQHYSEWEEIMPPRKMPAFRNPGQALDYQRFTSDSLCNVIIAEVEAVRSVDPQANVTTNALPFHKPCDYFEWYRHVDIAAWDSYPDPAGGLAEICANAFNHDLFRGVKGGLPFILMEQASTQVNWRPMNALKPPGQMRALSYQAMAHGADGVMFFQWRQSKAGAEKFHSAMVPHVRPEQSRVYREVKTLGAELQRLDRVLGARTPARVAVIVSWENRWALDLDSKPTQFNYHEILLAFYRPLWELNVAIDLVTPGADLSGYDVVCTPALYQLRQDEATQLNEFVHRGGTLIVTYFSGIADERDHIWLGGYPALLSETLGMWVEEWQPLGAGEGNSLRLPSQGKAEFGCSHFCELLHTTTAETIAVYSKSFYAGRPAITVNRAGRGLAYYVGTRPDHGFLVDWLGGILKARGIVAPIDAAAGVEATLRQTEKDTFLFVINHTGAPAWADFSRFHGRDLLSEKPCNGRTVLAPYDVYLVSPF